MAPSDIIATIGVSILLIAFFLQNLKVLGSEGVTYNLLNMTGAAIAGYASLLISFMPFVILECVWCMVALFGIVKIYCKREKFHVKQD